MGCNDPDGAVAAGTLNITADTTDPIMTKYGADTIVWEQGTTYKDPGAYCYDDVSGEEIYCLVDDSNVDESTPGTYTVEYTTMDSSGNTSFDTRTVIVDAIENTALSIAMICERNDCTNANKEVPLREHLVDLGYKVETFGHKNKSRIPTNYDLVVVSESVSSSNLEWLRDSPADLLTLEGANHDELFGDDGGKSAAGGETSIEITSQPHAIITNAESKLGIPLQGQTIEVTNNDEHLGFMKNNDPDVKELANYEGKPNKAKILAADAGVTDTNAGKRVFFGAQYFDNLNAAGVALFDSAVEWAAAP